MFGTHILETHDSLHLLYLLECANCFDGELAFCVGELACRQVNYEPMQGALLTLMPLPKTHFTTEHPYLHCISQSDACLK